MLESNNGGYIDKDAALKRIRTQIKYGRTEGVESKLLSLLSENRDTAAEIEILTIYAMDFLPDVGLYEQAIPQLERLLELDIPEDVRAKAHSLLSVCRKKAEVIPSEVCLEKQEFLDCMNIIKNGSIFKFDGGGTKFPDFHVITDIECAKETAWRQSIEEPFESWNGLRAKASRELYNFVYENKISLEPLKGVYLEIDKLCNENLSPLMRDFYDDVYGDLSNIILGKALGIEHFLHENTWRAYQQQVFPCGWRGSYPGGSLCVFAP